VSDRSRGELLGLALLAAAMVAAGLLVAGDYEHGLLVGFCVDLLLLTGLNLIVGYAGQVSLAQAGLFGLGAYTAGILSAKDVVPPAVAFAAAPVVVAAFSALVGLPSLRLRGLYFTMATLGAGVILYLVFGRAVSLTGGPNGLLGVPVLELGGFELDTPFAVYWLAAALALLGLVLARNLVRSRAGLALRAASASEPAAAVAGVETFRLRLLLFTLCGAYAGVAGALETFESGFVSPEPFGFFGAVTLLVVLALAGAGTLFGPVVGAGLMLVLDEVLADAADLQPLILGVLFLIAIQVMPQGVVGWIAERFGGRRRRRAPVSPERAEAAR
jgi:branched-chain amino acid transport system permease protein